MKNQLTKRIIGCVDGTHIKIIAPHKELQHLYYNRKGLFSINAMILYLMTTFRNSEEGFQRSFYNKQNVRGRNIDERTISVLKNRFRCLLQARALHYTPQKNIQIIKMCAALRNLCLESLYIKKFLGSGM
nr:uncharacterized protein LOC118680020 [Bactrocera oleae]